MSDKEGALRMQPSGRVNVRRRKWVRPEAGGGEEALISDKEGILQMQSSGRWAVCRPGYGTRSVEGTIL